MLKSEVVKRSPVVSLRTKEPRENQLGDCLVKTVQTVIASNGVSYLQMSDLTSSMSEREKRGKKEMMEIM